MLFLKKLTASISFLAILCLGHIQLFAQVQIGERLAPRPVFSCAITGDAAGTGSSVSLSSDGSQLLLGAPLECFSNGAQEFALAGKAYLFELDRNSWERRFLEVGSWGAEFVGNSVSISGQGDRFCIGAPKELSTSMAEVYHWDGENTSYPGGYSIRQETYGDRFGSTVMMSRDGNVFAVGAPGNDGNGEQAGHVQIGGYNKDISRPNKWWKLGNDIDGEAAGDHFGSAIAVSADGDRVAVGAFGNDGNGAESGHVRVYELNDTTWEQVGSDIDGEATGDSSGYAVALSADGNRLAIGAPHNDGNGLKSGHVRVFDWRNGRWEQAGVDIDGDQLGDKFGWAVSFSVDGNTLAVGAPGAQSGNGHVYILKWNEQDELWNQYGATIIGSVEGGRCGFAVSLSAGGDTIAVGEPGDERYTGRYHFSEFAGQVRVFDLSPASVGIEQNDVDPAINQIQYYPNPSKGNLTIDSPGQGIVSIEVYDLIGKKIPFRLSHGRFQQVISTSFKGMALIKVEVESGVHVEKVFFE